MTSWRPSSVWVERSALDFPMVERVRALLPGVPWYVVEHAREAECSDFAEGKQRLVLARRHGSFLQHCPAGTPGLVCCNYLVVQLGANCPFDCSYCFLQEYLATSPALKLFVNVADALEEVEDVLRAHPQRRLRIGTGELIDSLALDHISGHSEMLVPFFARHPNAVLELKTKSAAVEGVLAQPAAENIVVSWSLNAPSVIAGDEPGTASLAARLAAAARVQAAGFRVGFHFDPLLAFPGWEEEYEQVIRELEATVDARRVAWISLGHLRLTPGLKDRIKERGRASWVLWGELVPNADGKLRAWRGLRVKMYRQLLRRLRAWDERIPLYICMEPAGVWEKTFGTAPTDREVAARLLAEGV